MRYLEYLLYFKQPEYAKTLKYPQALVMLELVQKAEFRAAIAETNKAKFIEDQLLLHWNGYMRKRQRLTNYAHTFNNPVVDEFDWNSTKTNPSSSVFGTTSSGSDLETSSGTEKIDTLALSDGLSSLTDRCETSSDNRFSTNETRNSGLRGAASSRDSDATMLERVRRGGMDLRYASDSTMPSSVSQSTAAGSTSTPRETDSDVQFEGLTSSGDERSDFERRLLDSMRSDEDFRTEASQYSNVRDSLDTRTRDSVNVEDTSSFDVTTRNSERTERSATSSSSIVVNEGETDVDMDVSVSHQRRN